MILKKIIYCLLILITIYAIVYLYNTNPKFYSSVLNLGDQYSGKSITNTVTIYNNSIRPNEIINIVSSCGCAVARPETRKLNPFGKIDLSLVIDTPNENGSFNKNLKVFFKNGKSTVLHINANIIKPFLISNNHLNFIDLEYGIGTNITVEISSNLIDYNYENLLYEHSDNDFLKINSDIYNDKMIIDIEIPKNLEAGTFSKNIKLIDRNNPNIIIDIPIRGRVTGSYYLFPDMISFSNSTVGEIYTQSIKINGRYSKNIYIESVYPHDYIKQFMLSIKENTISLSFTPKSAGLVSGRIIINSNGERLSLPFLSNVSEN